MIRRKNNFGFLLVDKPSGWTSFDVCARLRKILQTKKIGHTGTLDPFATGLLLVAVGKATRLIPFFEKAKKIYEVEIGLGQTSETLDPESKIQKISPLENQEIPNKKFIQKIIQENFSGDISQIPPQYSALKIGGKKMCDLARKGIYFEIKPRKTLVHDCEILEYDFPVLKLRLSVSAGFYVRSLARDLGIKLYGSGMCLSLRRLGIGSLNFEDFPILPSQFLEKKSEVIFQSFPKTEEVSAILENYGLDLAKILNLPLLSIDSERVDDFLNGRAFPFDFPDFIGSDDLFLVQRGSDVLGLGRTDCQHLAPKICF